MMARRIPNCLPSSRFHTEPNELVVVVFSFRGGRQALFREKQFLIHDFPSRIDVGKFVKLCDPVSALSTPLQQGQLPLSRVRTRTQVELCPRLQQIQSFPIGNYLQGTPKPVSPCKPAHRHQTR